MGGYQRIILYTTDIRSEAFREAFREAVLCQQAMGRNTTAVWVLGEFGYFGCAISWVGCWSFCFFQFLKGDFLNEVVFLIKKYIYIYYVKIQPVLNTLIKALSLTTV